MTRWMHVNTAAGYVVFGVPTLLAIPAVAATIARFGIWHTLTSAVVPVAMVIAPLLLWTRYTRHRPAKRTAWLTWSGVAILVFLVLASSPLWFWTGPVLVVLLSELARAILVNVRHDDAAAQPTDTIVRVQP